VAFAQITPIQTQQPYGDSSLVDLEFEFIDGTPYVTFNPAVDQVNTLFGVDYGNGILWAHKFENKDVYTYKMFDSGCYYFETSKGITSLCVKRDSVDGFILLNGKFFANLDKDTFTEELEDGISADLGKDLPWGWNETFFENVKIERF
jgi:hypothetical protein